MTFMSLDTLESIPNIFVLIHFYLFFHIELVEGICPYFSAKNLSISAALFNLLKPLFKPFELRCFSVYFTW